MANEAAVAAKSCHIPDINQGPQPGHLQHVPVKLLFLKSRSICEGLSLDPILQDAGMLPPIRLSASLPQEEQRQSEGIAMAFSTNLHRTI